MLMPFGNCRFGLDYLDINGAVDRWLILFSRPFAETLAKNARAGTMTFFSHRHLCGHGIKAFDQLLLL